MPPHPATYDDISKALVMCACADLLDDVDAHGDLFEGRLVHGAFHQFAVELLEACKVVCVVG